MFAAEFSVGHRGLLLWMFTPVRLQAVDELTDRTFSQHMKDTFRTRSNLCMQLNMNPTA